MKSLQLFSFFHLNLMFSSIEEEARSAVIRCCYWPLLQLASSEGGPPLGIELTGYTLETIQSLEPEWVVELKRLIICGQVELIGSGYAQIIGPLVPAAINLANQRIGLQVYEELLGLRPELVLVNEQAYSAGLVPIYRAVGYRALIMEWDNPGNARLGWNRDWRYLPQYACGTDGSRLPVIWNKSIPFQKFQRYSHGEIELPEYLDFLGNQVGDEDRTFALYGNDTEIFDFRPNRFSTEAVLASKGEWQRIGMLYQAIQADKRFNLIRPGQVLDFLDHPNAGNCLHLESAAQPVPVKKQAKYNIMRWALTGRDDFGLNTACWQLFTTLSGRPESVDADWKELCFLWSSDFRTHITPKRWQRVQEQLTVFQQRLPAMLPVTPLRPVNSPDTFQVRREGNYLEIENRHNRLRLNCQRGLAVDGWWDKSFEDKPLIKTLTHGYFDDIHYAADFYTGHFVLEVPGQHKITDLCPVSPQWAIEDGLLVVRADILTSLGLVRKEIRVECDRPSFEMVHHFQWLSCPHGTLRLGHVTLNPEVFEQKSLFYGTHNGGEISERFLLGNEPINHLTPVSSLVSASQGLGVTEGLVEIGDVRRWLKIKIDKTEAALTGHIVYSPVDGRYFCRLVFSAMETDDTTCNLPDRKSFFDRTIRVGISV